MSTLTVWYFEKHCINKTHQLQWITRLWFCPYCSSISSRKKKRRKKEEKKKRKSRRRKEKKIRGRRRKTKTRNRWRIGKEKKWWKKRKRSGEEEEEKLLCYSNSRLFFEILFTDTCNPLSSSGYLNYALRSCARSYLGADFKKDVVSVPQFWQHYQRVETLYHKLELAILGSIKFNIPSGEIKLILNECLLCS